LLSYIVHNNSVSLSKPFQSRDIGGVVGDDGVGSVECVVYFIRTNRRLFNARTYKLDSIGGGKEKEKERKSITRL
jgi:hypothetical protein